MIPNSRPARIPAGAAAFSYLVRTPWTQVFDGPVFAVGLWVFGLDTVGATILGVLAIRTAHRNGICGE